MSSTFRSSRRPVHLQLCSHPLPALIPPPIKTIAAAAATLSVLAYFTARPVVAHLLSRRLNTELTIRELNINPFKRRITLSNIHLFDSLHRPLLSVPKLTLSFQAVPQITATSPTVTAIFDTTDFSKSNWTLFTSNLPPPRSKPETTPKPPPSTTKRPSAAPEINVSIEDALYLTLRTPQTSLPTIPLSPPPLNTATLTTPLEISRLITGLTSRALSYNLHTLPRDIRREARRYIRQALAEGVSQKVAVLKSKLETLRRSVETADELLQDIPRLGPIQSRLKSARSALKTFESILSGGGPDTSSEQFNNGTESPPNHVPEPQEFRELDEGDA